MDNEQRLNELERRRCRAARLLAAGLPQAEVARRVAVSRQSVSHWEKLRQAGGMAALRRPKHFGRPRKLSESQSKRLIKYLKTGALAAGFATERWTVRRIATVIEQRFAVRQRDEKAMRAWKAKRWAALRKSLREKAK